MSKFSEQDWDTDNRDLLIELAVQLVEFAYERTKIDQEEMRRFFPDFLNSSDCFLHHHMSDFECLCDVLERLDLAESGPDDTSDLVVRLNVGLDGVREKLQNELPNEYENLETVLEIALSVWINLMSSWVKDRPSLPTTRDAFEMPEIYAHFVPLLTRLHYLLKRDDRVEWTDRIGPAMVGFSQWVYKSQRDISDAELNRNQRENRSLLKYLFSRRES